MRTGEAAGRGNNLFFDLTAAYALNEEWSMGRQVEMRTAANVVLILLFAFVGAVRADWPQFRGPNSSGHADTSKPTAKAPTEFAPGHHELWSVPMPSGHSSPCIVADSIYLTSFNRADRELRVHCLDRCNGETRWSRPVPVDAIERGHPSFNPASSSPASDGERVVAYFGSFGLICFDKRGEKLWDIKMPLTKSYAGNATSPAIFGDRVILYRGNHVDHFILAVDKRTGDQLWKKPQAEPFASELACTSCPILVGNKLIIHSARSVQALDIDSGEQIWVAKCATTATSTPVIAGGDVIVAAWNKMGEPALRPKFPSFDELVSAHDKNQDQRITRNEFPRLMIFHRPDGAEAPQNGAAVGFKWSDSNKDGAIDKQEWNEKLNQLAAFRARYKTHGMLAIPIHSQGLIEASAIRTLEQQSIPEVPSPLVHNGYVHFVKNGGVLTTIELKSGKRTSRIRTKGRGTHYASPIIANDKLYSTAGDGVISVLSLGPKPKVLAVNAMKDDVYATPAVDNGVLYVRTHHKLYAFGGE